MLRILCGITAALLWVACAHAQEQWPIEAADFQVDGGFFFGNAVRRSGPHGTQTLNFQSTDFVGPSQVPFATAQIALPTWLTVPATLACLAVGRTATTDGSRRVGFRFAMLASTTQGLPTIWDDNQGSIFTNLSAQTMGIVPATTSEGTVSSTAVSAVVYDQATNAPCATASICAKVPVRLFLFRDNSIANNDAADFELIRLVCTAATT